MSDETTIVPAERADGIRQVVLLTNHALGRSLISAILNFRPGIRVVLAETIAALRTVPPADLAGARLISFCSAHIVPPDLLNALGYGGYNFHPGPPDYPGWAPFSFALYDGVKRYGVTVHGMTERVDRGPIVGVEYFPVPPNMTAPQLLTRANGAMFQLFATLANSLVNQIAPLPTLPIEWGAHSTTRKEFAARCQIPLDIAPETLRKTVRAFGVGDGFHTPTITLHGIPFTAVPPV